jgi:hypothetical protein
MIKIKLSIPGQGENLSLSQFLGNKNNEFRNFKFFVNDSSIDEVDFWFVIDDLNKNKDKVKVAPERVFFLTAEQVFETGHYNKLGKQNFLDQFYYIFSSYDIFRENVDYELPFLTWMINANHGSSIFSNSKRDFNFFYNLKSIEKSKKISVFCSNKIISANHLLRYNFVKKCKDYFGDSLDWFGNGVKPMKEKWDGIAPYKFHLALENQSRHNIISEKLYDSYLGLAFPIYWGAPNAGEYFSKESFYPIEIRNWKNSIDSIEKLLVNNFYEEKIPVLIKSKNDVLLKYNPFLRMIKIITNFDLPQFKKEYVTILSIKESSKYSIFNKIKSKFISYIIRSATKYDN